jgi:hypothetical protein
MRKIPLTIQNIFIYQFNYIIDLQNIPVLNYSIKNIKIKREITIDEEYYLIRNCYLEYKLPYFSFYLS